ncbi:DUF115 domain-containing protein [Campylobacter coli]|nr:DUF115 domain-containing protein [Campylobacter coli]EGP2596738.1 motility associated factor glycosyltransferase family protein [Campylobacter coli]
MNYALAVTLKHKNIILIGQDLAYSEDSSSHAEGFIHEDLHEGDFQRDKNHFKTIAYGGKGDVDSSHVWQFFKDIFEKWIEHDKKFVNIYNCTEGGARIEGTIEKPFKEICEILLNKELKKPFPELNILNINKQNELILKAYFKIHKSIIHCQKFAQELLREYNEIKEVYLILEKLTLEESKEFIDFIIQKIDKLKCKIDNTKNMQDLYEILEPILVQFELNLAQIYILNPKTIEEQFNKSLFWIREHLQWLELLFTYIQAQENVLLENIHPLETKIKKRGMEKYIKRIQDANK